MINKYKWLEILLFLPPIMFLVAINTIVDVSQYFHPEISEIIADSIIKGNAIRVLGNNGNERIIKQKLIEKMNKEVECVAIGSSLVMYIGAEAVKNTSFYNLGVSRADHYDIMATFGLLKINKIKYNKVILCVDFPIFSNTAYVKNNKKHNDLIDFTNYMIDYLEKNKQDIISSTNFFAKLKEAPLFSLTYFKDCLKYFIKQKSLNRIEIVKNNTKDQYYTSEASIFPPEKSNNNSEEDIIAAVKEIKSQPRFHDSFNGEIDTNCKKQFIQLVDYLQKQNVEIIFWYHPFPPALWDNTNWNQYPALKELDTWSRDFAQKKHIKTFGSYNPHEIGIKNIDFLDARHLKRSAITQHFKF